MKRFVICSAIFAVLLTGCSFIVRQTGPYTWEVQPVFFPTAVVTPTQEILPTVTPTPTITPTPTHSEPDACQLVVSIQGGVNIRQSPSTTAAKVGALQIGARRTALQFADSGGYLWARIAADQWIAVRSGTTWWAGWEHEDLCPSVPGWPVNRTGLHMTWNIHPEQIATAFANLGTLKATTGNGYVLAEAKMANPAIVTVYRRTAPDCPPDGMSAVTWMNLIAQDWPPGADYYEMVNECILPTDRWVELSIGAMQWAAARQKCLLLFSFAVGQPEIGQWQQLTPAFDYALANPCAGGRLHGVALHAYTAGSTLDNPWLFSRFGLLCASIADIYCNRLPLYLTEVGDDPQTQGAVDCGRWLAFAHEVERVLAGTVVDGYHLWSVGYGTGWVDATACMGGL